MTTARELTDPLPSKPTVLTPDQLGGLKVGSPSKAAPINMLIYGEPKVGKTRLAGSSVLVPGMSPVLDIDFEGGTLSLADDYPQVDIWPDPSSERRPTWRDVTKLYAALYDKNPYKTIILDSLTEIQKFCMGQIMSDVVKKDSTRDPDIASMREWGKMGEQMRRLVRALRDLPCNVIFTALAKESRTDRDGTVKNGPALPGQMRGEMAGYVDIVVFMYKKEVREGTERLMKTLLLSQGTERHIAGDRSGKLPSIMEEPTMQDIYNYIHGQREKDNGK
jgi:AAA domain